MLKELSIFTNTYKRYLKYLYINVFKEDKIAFNKHYKTLKESVYVGRAVEFLEQENVPVLEALTYYNYAYPNAKFNDKLKNMILKEFYRIENNINCNYIPF